MSVVHLENLSLPPMGKLTYMSLRDDASLLTTAYTNGFQVFSTRNGRHQPTLILSRVISPAGGIGIVEAVGNTNLFLLVGGGSTPCFKKNVLTIWDDAQLQTVGSIAFESDIRAVRLSCNHSGGGNGSHQSGGVDDDFGDAAPPIKVFVLLDERLSIFELAAGASELSAVVGENPRGLLATAGPSIALYPAQSTGKLCVRYLETGTTQYMECHGNSVGIIATNSDGSLTATASENGTVVRVYETGGRLVNELRRGTMPAVVTSLCFSSDDRFIACASTRGKVHIFKTYPAPKDGDTPSSVVMTASDMAVNPAAAMKGVLKSYVPNVVSSYYNPERCFASFAHVDLEGMATVCAFEPLVSSQQNFYQLHVFTHASKYFKVSFPATTGGECTVEQTLELTVPTAA
eukprot:PhM_4_TR9278/c1_g1_i1/m.81337